mgnify:CR=1 FL=1
MRLSLVFLLLSLVSFTLHLRGLVTTVLLAALEGAVLDHAEDPDSYITLSDPLNSMICKWGQIND